MLSVDGGPDQAHEDIAADCESSLSTPSRHSLQLADESQLCARRTRVRVHRHDSSLTTGMSDPPTARCWLWWRVSEFVLFYSSRRGPSLRKRRCSQLRCTALPRLRTAPPAQSLVQFSDRAGAGRLKCVSRIGMRDDDYYCY